MAQAARVLSLLEWVSALAAPLLWALGMAVAWTAAGIRMARRRVREHRRAGRHRK